jgi:hypothetical protein
MSVLMVSVPCDPFTTITLGPSEIASQNKAGNSADNQNNKDQASAAWAMLGLSVKVCIRREVSYLAS